MSRVCRGVLVRALYSACITLITLLVVVMYEGKLVGSIHWVCMAGVCGLFIEFFITWRATQGFDWKWFSPCTVIFCAASLVGIWMAQIRYTSYKTEGVYVCYNTSIAEEIQNNDFSTAETWLNFCMCGHCNGAAEQLFLTLLIAGRYLLPKGVSFYNSDDKVHNFLTSLAKTHFVLAVACNAADVMDIISHTRMPGIRGEYGGVSIILILFSLGCVQFCLNIFSTAEEKRSDIYIIIETDLWSSIAIMLTCDLPYLIVRLYFLLTAKVFSPFGVFFLCKNILYTCFTLHKIIMVCYGKDMNEIEEYVNADPGSLPPPRRYSRENTRLEETPDGLDDISDSQSVYSNEIPVRSRNEKRQVSASGKQTDDWGEDSQWFSNPSLKQREKSELREQPPLSPQQIALPKEWDVENQTLGMNGVTHRTSGPSSTHFKGYFTEGYIDDFEVNLDFSKIGTRDEIILPLGAAVMRGSVDFTNAPEPQIREVSTSKSKQTPDNDEVAGSDEEKEKKSKKKKKKKDKKNRDEDIDESIDEILDDEEPKERKKKKKRDKRENAEEGSGEESRKNRDEDGNEEEVEQKKKKKKKKSRKSEVRETEKENESDDENKRHRKRRHKDLDKDDYL